MVVERKSVFDLSLFTLVASNLITLVFAAIYGWSLLEIMLIY